MKRMALLLLCILALALTASAQQEINFSDLPLIATPAPIPSGYGGLNWNNLFYVDPALWSSAGAGYQNFFTHRDVAFVGGQFCGPVRSGCYGVITSVGPSFVPVSAVVSAGYQANQITVLAYNHSTYVGSITYNLTTTPQVVNFPAWGAVSEMQIQTDQAGDLVLFNLSVYPTT